MAASTAPGLLLVQLAVGAAELSPGLDLTLAPAVSALHDLSSLGSVRPAPPETDRAISPSRTSGVPDPVASWTGFEQGLFRRFRSTKRHPLTGGLHGSRNLLRPVCRLG